MSRNVPTIENKCYLNCRVFIFSGRYTFTHTGIAHCKFNLMSLPIPNSNIQSYISLCKVKYELYVKTFLFSINICLLIISSSKTVR